MMFYLGWCKINCCFVLLKFAIWYWNIFLKKSGYIMHPFNAFGSETANECTVQCWSKMFCKGGKNLEEEDRGGRPSEVAMTDWKPSSKLSLLQLHKKLPKNSVLTILWSFSIWSKLEKWKSSVNRCLMSWKNFKIIILKCHLLLFYATTMNHFLIRLWWKMNFI